MDDSAQTRSVWITPARKARARAGQAYTRDDVARVAVALADTDGLVAVTMRSVAEQLGVTAMSLYWYVEGKNQIVELMIDRAIAEQPRPRGRDWRAVLRSVARGKQKMLAAHPWLVSVRDRPNRVPSPSQLAHYEQIIRALRRHHPQLRAGDLNVVISTLDHLAAGHAALAFPRVLADTRDDAATTEYLLATIGDGDHPELAGFHGELREFTSDRFDDEIEVVLDGLARYFAG